MLSKKNFKVVDSILTVLTAFTDRCTRCVKEAAVTKVCALYSELTITMTKDEDKRSQNEHQFQELQLQEITFERQLVNIFSAHRTFGLFTLKFHFLDYALGVLRIF